MSWLPSAVWLVLLIVFGIAEAATVGLVSIWFAAGSLLALLAAVLGAPVPVQVLIFVAGSLVTLVIIRPLAGKYINGRRVPTNADRVIGQEAVVTEAIDNLHAQGQVKVAGAPWTARSDDDAPISAGTTVRVLRIEGVKLYVAPIHAAKETPQ